MGCDIEITPGEGIGDEPAGTVRVRYSPDIEALEVPVAEVPNLIDEIPVLSLLCVAARGTSVFHEVAELRVKESNRLAAIVDGLAALGCSAREEGDDLVIEPGRPTEAVTLDPLGDHRLAMTWTLANECFGLSGGVADRSCIDVSYPDFMGELARLRA